MEQVFEDICIRFNIKYDENCLCNFCKELWGLIRGVPRYLQIAVSFVLATIESFQNLLLVRINV